MMHNLWDFTLNDINIVVVVVVVPMVDGEVIITLASFNSSQWS
jgi:hypothetical protein